jgi:hypothetical protein
VHLTLFWTQPQNYIIVYDEDLDKVAQKDLQVIRQAWANMTDTERTILQYMFKGQYYSSLLMKVPLIGILGV